MIHHTVLFIIHHSHTNRTHDHSGTNNTPQWHPIWLVVRRIWPGTRPPASACVLWPLLLHRALPGQFSALRPFHGSAIPQTHVSANMSMWTSLLTCRGVFLEIFAACAASGVSCGELTSYPKTVKFYVATYHQKQTCAVRDVRRRFGAGVSSTPIQCRALPLR